jgi:hypothetical protein
MPDDQQVPDRDRARAAAGVSVPDAVRAAWSGARPEPEPGQLWRALWDEVARFVVVLHVDEGSADVAPVTVDPELATDDAHLLDAGETAFGVPVAVWLGLHAPVPVRVLDRPVGSVHIAVDALRKAPQGRPILTPLDERAMEEAVLQDDMDELAAVPAADATLQDLLSSVTVEAMKTFGFPPPLALALRRGLRALTPEQAQTLAPLAKTTPAALLRANPPLPVDLVRDLDDPASREWVVRLAARQGEGEQAARLAAGYGAYALAARETGKGSIDWKSRIARYVQAILGDQ